MQTVSISLEDLFDSSKKPKERVPSRAKVNKVQRTLTSSEEHLIDFWIETGKLRRDGRFPGDTSKNVYLFQHEVVGDLELSMPWEEFFQVFNGMNHAAFLKEMEGEIVENPFDPWRNPRMVGISIRIKPFEDDDLRPYNRQDYRLVEVFSSEDAENRADESEGLLSSGKGVEGFRRLQASQHPRFSDKDNTRDTQAENSPERTTEENHGNTRNAPDSRSSHRVMQVFICGDRDSDSE